MKGRGGEGAVVPYPCCSLRLRALADAVPATQKSLDAPVASHLGLPGPSPRSLGALTEDGGGGEGAAGRSAFVEFEKKVKA
jgi:hypothetical protein